jgi:hypothetical protein
VNNKHLVDIAAEFQLNYKVKIGLAAQFIKQAIQNASTQI